MSDLPSLSAIELDRLCADLIAEIKAEMDAFDENGAIREAAMDDGKSTDLRACEALLRPERFAGEHAVAKAWLKNHARKIWSDK